MCKFKVRTHSLFVFRKVQEKRNAAALKMQKVFRGHKGRKIAGQMSDTRDDTTKLETSNPSSNSDPESENIGSDSEGTTQVQAHQYDTHHDSFPLFVLFDSDCSGCI